MGHQHMITPNIAERLRRVDFKGTSLGPVVAEHARVGRNCYLGHGTVVYPGVSIGDQCVILDGAVLGRIPISNGTTTREIVSEFGSLTIGDGSIVGAGAVLYSAASFGRRVLIGDLASVREGAQIGDGVIIGRGAMLLYDCTVGRFSRIQDQVHLVGAMVVEEHVFIGMGVVATNDNDVYLSRFGISRQQPRGPIVRRLAAIGAGATILPGVEIGEGALVGAGSVVTRDVEPWTIVMGVPARAVRAVPDEWQAAVIDGAAAMDTAWLESATQLAPA
jgi:UDP-2-acetamido-3-amino-2,3-dideoxy-glucuronate N-acetyltransferase